MLGGRDDALDLLGRKHRCAIERERLGLRLRQLDRDVVPGALRDAVNRARIGIIGARVDLEPIALAGAIFPGRRAEVAEGDFAFAAVEFGNLTEFGGVALAGAAGEIVQDAPARAVDRVGAARLHQAQLIERLMRPKRPARRGLCLPACETRSQDHRGDCEQTERRPRRVSHV